MRVMPIFLQLLCACITQTFSSRSSNLGPPSRAMAMLGADLEDAKAVMLCLEARTGKCVEGILEKSDTGTGSTFVNELLLGDHKDDTNTAELTNLLDTLKVGFDFYDRLGAALHGPSRADDSLLLEFRAPLYILSEAIA